MGSKLYFLYFKFNKYNFFGQILDFKEDKI
jgi:hypothetical protein